MDYRKFEVEFAGYDLRRAIDGLQKASERLAKVEAYDSDDEELIQWASESEALWLRMQDLQNQIADLVVDAKKFEGRYPKKVSFE